MKHLTICFHWRGSFYSLEAIVDTKRRQLASSDVNDCVTLSIDSVLSYSWHLDFLWDDFVMFRVFFKLTPTGNLEPSCLYSIVLFEGKYVFYCVPEVSAVDA